MSHRTIRCEKPVFLRVLLRYKMVICIIGSECNLSDYPTKVGFRIFCRISSDYEKYARSLSDFNIFDHYNVKTVVNYA